MLSVSPQMKFPAFPKIYAQPGCVSVCVVTHWSRWCGCSGSDHYLTGLEQLSSPTWATGAVWHCHILGWDISFNCKPNCNRKCGGVCICFGILITWFCTQTRLEKEITMYHLVIRQMLNDTKYSCKFLCKYLNWDLIFISHFINVKH